MHAFQQTYLNLIDYAQAGESCQNKNYDSIHATQLLQIKPSTTMESCHNGIMVTRIRLNLVRSSNFSFFSIHEFEWFYDNW